MIKLAFIFSTLFTLSTSSMTNDNLGIYVSDCENSVSELPFCVYDFYGEPKDIDWSAFELIEIEEEVELGFNPKDYLPEGFNPLKGMHNLDWSKIELIKIDEEVELGFNPKDYLPEGFNPLKGMHDLDWSTFELIEIEEEVELGFNPKDYLPSNFNPYLNMCTLKS